MVTNGDAGSCSTPDTATAPQAGSERAAKAKGGAPKGNTNAAKHLAYSKRARREQRDAHRRRAERESRQILVGLGLGSHPLAKRIGRRLTDVETEIARLRSFLDARGRHDTHGKPKPAYERYLELQRQDRAELRHLLDELGVIGTGTSREIKHVVEIKRTEPPENWSPTLVYVCVEGHQHSSLVEAKDCTKEAAETPPVTPVTADPQQPDNGHKRGVRKALLGYLDKNRKTESVKPEEEQDVKQTHIPFPGSGWASDDW